MWGVCMCEREIGGREEGAEDAKVRQGFSVESGGRGVGGTPRGQWMHTDTAGRGSAERGSRGFPPPPLQLTVQVGAHLQ